jgi:hypothetical protein
VKQFPDLLLRLDWCSDPTRVPKNRSQGKRLSRLAVLGLAALGNRQAFQVWSAWNQSALGVGPCSVGSVASRPPASLSNPSLVLDSLFSSPVPSFQLFEPLFQPSPPLFPTCILAHHVRFPPSERSQTTLLYRHRPFRRFWSRPSFRTNFSLASILATTPAALHSLSEPPLP